MSNKQVYSLLLNLIKLLLLKKYFLNHLKKFLEQRAFLIMKKVVVLRKILLHILIYFWNIKN